jgi:hypothetical protein
MKGAKCKYNEYHRKSFRCSQRINDRTGIILGETRDGSCYYILWDSAKGKKIVSKSFIEIIAEPIKIEQIANQLTELNNFYNSNLEVITKD